MIYAIGDIHGQARKLRELLSQLPLIAEDQLVFVGDYVDRGPDTAAVIDQLLELQEGRPDTVFFGATMSR